MRHENQNSLSRGAGVHACGCLRGGVRLWRDPRRHPDRLERRSELLADEAPCREDEGRRERRREGRLHRRLDHAFLGGQRQGPVEEVLCRRGAQGAEPRHERRPHGTRPLAPHRGRRARRLRGEVHPAHDRHEQLRALPVRGGAADRHDHGREAHPRGDRREAAEGAHDPHGHLPARRGRERRMPPPQRRGQQGDLHVRGRQARDLVRLQ